VNETDRKKCKCIRKLSPAALQRLRFELGTKAAALELDALRGEKVCGDCGRRWFLTVEADARVEVR
jgi:hypothetical protein